MKKLLSVIVLAFAFTAGAANHTVQSFIAPLTLCVSNTLGVTNLLTSPALAGFGGTNQLGTVFTNYLGVEVVTTNSGATPTMNLLKDVALWADATASISTTNAAIYNAAIFIRLTGQSGANSAVVFTFIPVPDGTYEDQVSTDAIAVSVTANTTAEVDKLTPLDMTKLVGCKALRLRTVTNGDGDATSRVNVLTCELVGWTP